MKLTAETAVKHRIDQLEERPKTLWSWIRVAASGQQPELEIKVKYEQIGQCTFTAALLKHGSWGHRDQGIHPSTMTMYIAPDYRHGWIEWDIPSLSEFEEIGLWFDADRNLTDYDGIMALPREAIALLRSLSFNVSEEFE